VSARAFDPTIRESIERSEKRSAEKDAQAGAQPEQPANNAAPETPATDQPANSAPEHKSNFGWIFGRRGLANTGGRNMDMQTKVKMTVLESINQILWLPAQILVFSFSAIIIALLYLKTRLAGGEELQELIERFEDDGRPRKKWQERVRERLIQSGRIPSRP